MKESAMSERLTLRWVPVVDDRGHTRLEAVWEEVPRPRDQVPHAA